MGSIADRIVGGTLMRKIQALFVALALAAGLPATAYAQELNASERTVMTFSGPVELPGITLPAGTYVFRLADTPGRNVVQVLTEDQQKVLGQWLFVQTQRPRVSEETVVTFRETPAGTPPAVRYWFFPGELVGKEFVYPRDQALKIAARSGERVLTTEGEVTADSSVAAVDPQGNIAPVREAAATPAPAPQPTPSATPAPAPPAQAAVTEAPPRPQPAPAAPAQPAPEAQTAARTELPRTAGLVPLLGVVGLLSLGTGLLLGYRRRV
jgi:hypothetical protein